ncbi:MAG: hypothetical protein H7Y86_16560 [Rhizobacter sp.]|nr:hypothetical protein [Ferruginibacter sp.]
MKRDPSATEGSEDLGDQYKDERTEKKIHEHLNNEEDIITEQDIANAPAGPVNKKDAAPADINKSKKEELKEEANDQEGTKIKDNEDPDIQTSWNILGS